MDRSESHKSIKHWPEYERPRERLLAHGPGSVSEAQLIAIILRTGGSGRTAMDIALQLLSEFGTLKKIELASVSELCRLKGLGRAKAAQLKAALELGRRLFKEPPAAGPLFSNGRDVYAHFDPFFRNMKKEVFCCAIPDVKNRLLKEHRISEGTLTSSVVHPREAFKEAIKESAASVIFVHNHPSGDPEPSREDIMITEKLGAAGETLGIKVLDHVIVGEGRYASMLEKGYLK